MLPFARLRILLICLLAPFFTRAGIFHTANSGTWSAPSVWINGQIPPLSGTDTIFIHHHLTYTYPTVLTTTTVLIIDTGGSLCGHERFYVQAGSNVTNNGDFYADTLILNGGHLFNNNYIVLANMAVVTNGGGIANNGSMVIGLSFVCSQVADAIEEKNITDNFIIYPNPVSYGQEIHIENLPENYELLIIDLQGKIVRSMEAAPVISPGDLDPGIYFIEVKAGEILFHRKIIVTD
jgi:hypothetical protein